MSDEEAFSMTRGSRYAITSLAARTQPLRTSGVFQGYTTVGTDDAVVMELDASHEEAEGRIRVIPLHVILAIDVLEVAEEEKAEAQRETMYG